MSSFFPIAAGIVIWRSARVRVPIRLGTATEIFMAGDNTSAQGGSSSGQRSQAAGALTSRSAEGPLEVLGSDIRLTVPARSENVAVVRHMVGAFADALGLPQGVRDDVRLVVTEACTNVVLHAYAGDDGVIEVVMRARDEALELIVADAGRGLGPSPDTGPGLGLPLIATLADSLEIDRSPSVGSRLIMRFLRARPRPAMGLT
jgi:serine/threonine-protein kinase RsbW